MFFLKYLIVLHYKISYFLAKIQTSVENIWDSVTKSNMSIVLGLYFMAFYVLCYNLLEKFCNIRYTLLGDYGILMYFLICGVIYYKLNLTWIRAIELTKNQKNISRTILLVLFLTLAFKIYMSIKK
jgi:uncharacterized membrane protein YbhN (UPF0104 family)